MTYVPIWIHTFIEKNFRLQCIYRHKINDLFKFTNKKLNENILFLVLRFFAHPGKVRGLFTNIIVSQSFIHSLTAPLRNMVFDEMSAVHPVLKSRGVGLSLTKNSNGQ